MNYLKIIIVMNDIVNLHLESFINTKGHYQLTSQYHTYTLSSFVINTMIFQSGQMIPNN